MLLENVLALLSKQTNCRKVFLYIVQDRLPIRDSQLTLRKVNISYSISSRRLESEACSSIGAQFASGMSDWPCLSQTVDTQMGIHMSANLSWGCEANRGRVFLLAVKPDAHPPAISNFKAGTMNLIQISVPVHSTS